MAVSQEQEPYRGTRAHRPDLDWSQIRETVLMLELMSGQIMGAMRDSDRSVEVLTKSFTGMSDYLNSIVDVANHLPDTPELSNQKMALVEASGQVRGMVYQAVVAFQFYDRLVQKLSHVVGGHAEFAEIVGNSAKLYDPASWLGLHEHLRNSFSTQEEHVLIDAVLGGMPVPEAIERYLASLHREENQEIELF